MVWPDLQQARLAAVSRNRVEYVTFLYDLAQQQAALPGLRVDAVKAQGPLARVGGGTK